MGGKGMKQILIDRLEVEGVSDADCAELEELMADPDPEHEARAMQAVAEWINRPPMARVIRGLRREFAGLPEED